MNEHEEQMRRAAADAVKHGATAMKLTAWAGLITAAFWSIVVIGLLVVIVRVVSGGVEVPSACAEAYAIADRERVPVASVDPWCEGVPRR